MNILYVINHAGKGGSEKYVKTLAQHFQKKDKIHFIYNEEGLLCKQMKELGIQPVHVNMKGPFDFVAVKKIANYCKENSIDIIHTQFQRENYLAIFVKRYCPNVKVIYTSHLNLKNNSIWKATNLFMGKKDDAIIAVCSLGKKLLIANGMPKNKIKIIFNGVVYKEPSENHDDSQSLAVRKEFGITDDDFVFVALTRFTAEKGNLFLLESVKKLKTKKRPSFKIILCGDGELLAEAKVFATENNLNDDIIFAGYRTDTERILSAGNAFINSSSSEALSFAILEAMGKGLPIIATNVGGNPDIVNEGTRCGILVEYNHPDEMAEAMNKMLTDKDFVARCRKNSLRSVKNIFNIDKVVEKTYGIYKNLL